MWLSSDVCIFVMPCGTSKQKLFRALTRRPCVECAINAYTVKENARVACVRSAREALFVFKRMRHVVSIRVIKRKRCLHIFTPFSSSIAYSPGIAKHHFANFQRNEK
jgi:hypothetical protein